MFTIVDLVLNIVNMQYGTYFMKKCKFFCTKQGRIRKDLVTRSGSEKDPDTKRTEIENLDPY